MPSGEHTVFATGPDGEGMKITTLATEADAERLNALLQTQLALAAKGEASRPFVDFNHDGADAAAIPVSFFWDDGIRLAVEWTTKGLEALKGRVFSYFSPEFLLDGKTVSLPEVGPIGGLVNTPAFQTIERLSAKMPDNPEQQNKGTTMKDLIAKLAAAGMLPADKPEMTEDEMVAAIKAKFDGIAAELTASKGEATTAAAKHAEEMTTVRANHAKEMETIATADVDAAIADGRIEASAKPAWLASYKANTANARGMLASIKRNVTAGHNPNNLPAGKGAGELTGRARVLAAMAKGN
jgi:phage I-like protein